MCIYAQNYIEDVLFGIKKKQKKKKTSVMDELSGASMTWDEPKS
jgi:hypothetical protein